MKINIEFTGVAQMLVDHRMIDLEISPGTSYRSIVRILGEKYPSLIGLIIDQDGETLLSSNMFVIDGNMATPAMTMNEVPEEGCRLILMSLITGG